MGLPWRRLGLPVTLPDKEGKSLSMGHGGLQIDGWGILRGGCEPQEVPCMVTSYRIQDHEMMEAEGNQACAPRSPPHAPSFPTLRSPEARPGQLRAALSVEQ